MSITAPPRSLARLRSLLRGSAGASEWAVLRWLVPLALLQGAIFLALVPPWQHYDEPSHFVYAAGIAAGASAAGGGQGAALSREIADSMYRHGFWPEEIRPEMLSAEGPSIGEDQRVHPPLYYSLVAAPLKAMRFQPVEQQLYAARAVSLVFYVLTVVAAWRIAVAVQPDEPLLQLAVPLLLILTPTFADLMTAVNNDVPVNFAATVSLLGAVLILRHGLRPAALALLVLGLGVGLLAKRTAIPLVVPVAFALYWAVQRRSLPWWVVLPFVGVALCALGAFTVRPAIADGPSGSHQILAVQPWLDSLFTSYLRINLDAWVRSVSDSDLIGGRYQELLGVVFVSFWTRFGWGQVSAGALWDWAFGALAVAACLGLLAGALRPDSALPLWRRRALWLALITVICGWVAVFARFHPLPPIGQWTYFPRGRYMFWSMVPHLWLLVVGLGLVAPARLRRFVPLALLGFFALYTGAVYITFLTAYDF